MKIIDSSTLKEKLGADGVRVVDVRSASEFAAGHIPTAINIPDDEVLGRLEDIGHPASLLLVCQSGMRSEIVCARLAQAYPDALMLDGGTDAWIAAGLPVVRTTSTTWGLERQVRLLVGAVVLATSLLALFVNPLFAIVPAAMAAGMLHAAITNFCLMSIGFKHLPWNRGAPAAPAEVAESPAA